MKIKMKSEIEKLSPPFVNLTNLIKYKKFQISMTDKIAEKGIIFEITRYRIVKIVVEIVNRRIIDLTLHNILHIPNLHSNLISISKIYRLGLAIIFGEDKVIVSLSNNRIAIFNIKHEGLYHIRTVDKPKIFVMKLVQEPNTINN